MNIFIRINDTLITSPTNDRILDGITRKSIIEIAENLKILDRKIVLNSMILKWENVQKEFYQLIEKI